MRAHYRQIRNLKILIASGWVGSAFAADPVLHLTLALPAELSPLALVSVAAFISAWGGASFSVQRWAKGENIDRWRQYLVRDVVCAQTAGFGMFFMSVYGGWPPPLAAIAVLVSSYGGSRIIDAAVTKLEMFIQRKAEQLTQEQPPK